MTEEELRAICKRCRERYPNWDCWGCPNYADVELVRHEQSQADRIAKLEAELEQVKRERDAAVKCLCTSCKKIALKGNMITCCEMCHWHGAKDGG